MKYTEKLKFWKRDEADKFSFFYTFIIGIYLLPMLVVVALHDSGYFFSLTLFYIILVSLFLGIYLLYKFILYFIKRQWFGCYSILLAPVTVIGTLYLIALTGLFNLPNWIRFKIHKHNYMEQIALMPDNGKPKYKIFHLYDLGGFSATEISEDIIYDESDQILISSKNSKCDSINKIEGYFYYSSSIYGCSN